MNNLVELLEMQAEIDALIQEEVSNLTVGEYIQLQEAGIFNESAGKVTRKIARIAGEATGVLKRKPGTYIQNVNALQKKLNDTGRTMDNLPMGDAYRKVLHSTLKDKNQKKVLRTMPKIERGLKLAATGAVVARGTKIARKIAKNKMK